MTWKLKELFPWSTRYNSAHEHGYFGAWPPKTHLLNKWWQAQSWGAGHSFHLFMDSGVLWREPTTGTIVRSPCGLWAGEQGTPKKEKVRGQRQPSSCVRRHLWLVHLITFLWISRKKWETFYGSTGINPGNIHWNLRMYLFNVSLRINRILLIFKGYWRTPAGEEWRLYNCFLFPCEE